MPTPRILIIGSINIDLVVEVDRLPFEGETLVGRRMTQAPGGKGANQAVAVARLGGRASFCGRVGDDDWGKMVAGSLGESGVGADGLQVDRERATGSAIILVEPSGKNQIIAVGGANLGVCEADVDRSLTAAAGLHAVMLTLETPLATVQHAIGKAGDLGLPVVLDAAPPASYPLHHLRGVTILSPNETEARSLTGIDIASLDDARHAAALLREGSGAKHVVLKLAERGAMILDEAGPRWMEPIQVRAVDSTACGDAFTAAMTLRYCQTGDIDDAVRHGNAAGALTATKAGAQVSLPTEAELHAFVNR